MASHDFFAQQTVLMTGSTGHLGACLLYKLVLVLGVAEVQVLIRTTPEAAIAKWRALMPAHVGDLLRSGKIIFIRGDMATPGLDLSAEALRRIVHSVTLVINAAANISLRATLREAVTNNCHSALELARLATGFPRLLVFVQISSLFALSFLPDGPVDERIYPIADAEGIIRDVSNGADNDWEGYAWPYARSKHLMECLLTERYPGLPLIILRPSSIGPAIAQPFELYGPTPSIPISTFYTRLMLPSPGTSLFRATRGSRSGTNVLDEIPVDLVANILLQHVARGSRGPIHACSRSYVPRTFDQVVSAVQQHVPRHWADKMTTVVFSTDPASRVCQLADFYRVSTRGWAFCNAKSTDLDRTGPIGLVVPGHDVEEFTKRRVRQIFEETVTSQSLSKPKPRL